MKILPILFVTCQLPAIASGEELTWSILVGRRDLWPAQCTLIRPIRFRQGGIVEADQRLDVF
jgi:hypothetical protein